MDTVPHHNFSSYNCYFLNVIHNLTDLFKLIQVRAAEEVAKTISNKLTILLINGLA